MRGVGGLAKNITSWRTTGGQTDGGCGAVMRSHPYALRFPASLEKAVRIAVDHGRMTHRDPISDAAVAAQVAGVWLAVHRWVPKTKIADAMIKFADRYSRPTAEMLAWTLTEQKRTVVMDRMRGWAAHEAVCAGLWCFMNTDNVKDSLRAGADTPGDSDSIASLAGALTGGYLGEEELPEDWVQILERVGKLEALARATVSRSPGRMEDM